MVFIFIFLSLNIFCQNIEVIYQKGSCKIFSKEIPYLSCSDFYNLDRSIFKELINNEIKYPFTVLTGSNSKILLREKDSLIFIDEYNIVNLESIPKIFDNEHVFLDKMEKKTMDYDKTKKIYPSLKFKIYEKKDLIFEGIPFKETIGKEINFEKYKYYIIRISKRQDFKDYLDLISKIPLRDLKDFKNLYKNFYFKIAGIEKYDGNKLFVTNFSDIKSSKDIN